MSFRCALPLALTLLASHAGAQTLTRVRVEADGAPHLARALTARGYDVLGPTVQAGSFEAIVAPQELDALRASEARVIELSAGRPFAEVQRERLAAAPEGGVPSGYPDLAQILSQLAAAEAAFPGLCRVHDLTAELGAPTTAEGRHLFALQISDNVALEEDEPTTLIVSEHHARELVTPLIALHAIDRLTSQYGIDPTITQLVDDNEVWIVPVWNPDGYEYVFNVDNWWRKNRRDSGDGNFGVDLNRNYPLGWVSGCSGSTFTFSETYAGPSAASEAETQTMLAFGADRRFAKLFDFHSFAEEVRYGFGCLPHPFIGFLASEAAAYSVAGGYGGATGPSCCTAGDIHWHMANWGTHAFLWETHTDFQPTHASALAEAAKVFPAILALLQRPISVWGHVTDALSGVPVAATIDHPGAGFQNGEVDGSGGPFGRYDLTLPPGTWNVRFSSSCYQTQTVQVTVGAGTSQQLEIALQPNAAPATVYCTAKPSSIAGCTPGLGFNGVPSASAGSGFDVLAGPVPGKNLGLYFYTTNGAAAVPVQNAFGWLCVQTGSGFFRILPAIDGGGTSGVCDGQYVLDFNQYLATQLQDPNLVAGAQVDLQCWYRDPPNSGAANLTAAAAFSLCP